MNKLPMNKLLMLPTMLSVMLVGCIGGDVGSSESSSVATQDNSDHTMNGIGTCSIDCSPEDDGFTISEVCTGPSGSPSVINGPEFVNALPGGVCQFPTPEPTPVIVASITPQPTGTITQGF